MISGWQNGGSEEHIIVAKRGNTEGKADFTIQARGGMSTTISFWGRNFLSTSCLQEASYSVGGREKLPGTLLLKPA